MANAVVAQAPNLRSVESFLKDYKPVTPEDMKDITRESYDDFAKRLRSDPVRVMVEASDLGMDLEQYGNFKSPETMVEQGRSWMHRFQAEEGIYVNNTAMSAPATVAQCMSGGPHQQAILYHILTRAWEKKAIKDRSSITIQESAPLHTPPNMPTHSTPPVVPVGLRLNPGELVATMHSITTNSYSPFKWKYEKEDMERTAVEPGENIPASTLGESEGNIPMQKWGNRFVLPYEMLSGGQGMRINKLAQMVMLDSSTESVRQYGELVGVLENGDGAELVDGADPTAAKVEGIKNDYGAKETKFEFIAFLNWIDEALDEPFQITHVLMPKEIQRQLRATAAALQGDMTIEHLNSIGLAPSSIQNMERQMGVRFGRTPDGAISNAAYIIGLDANFAVEKVMRAGMTIRQQAQNIANQTENVVISDTYLWSRLSPEAVKVLNTAA